MTLSGSFLGNILVLSQSGANYEMCTGKGKGSEVYIAVFDDSSQQAVNMFVLLSSVSVVRILLYQPKCTLV